MKDYASLRSLIAEVRRRWAAQVVLRAAAAASAAAAVPVLVALAIDRVAAPNGLALLGLVLASAMLSAAAAAFVIGRCEYRVDDRRVARFIEERAAAVDGRALDDTVVSAVDLGRSAESPRAAAFLPLLAAAAMRRLESVEAGKLIPSAAIRRSAVEAAGGAALLVLALVLAWPTLVRAVDTGRTRFFPESIAVEVTPGDVRVPLGAPLRIRAAVRGASGAVTRVAPSLTVAAGGASRTVEMLAAGQAHEFAFESVDRSFTYFVAAGSARSAEYTVTALVAPEVTRIDVHYAYPAFTGMAPREEEDGGDIYAPAGTRVRVRVHTDRPAAHGSLALGRSAPVVLRRTGEKTLEGGLVLTADDSYRVALGDADGLASSGQTEYFIRLLEDRPPDVRILRPSADQQITPLEEVTIEARADDDHGIALLDLVYSIGGGPERRVPFDRVTGSDVQKIGSRLLAAENLGVKPGDVITYYARARDVGRGKRPSEARSDLFFLEVKPFSEEFEAAQSQAGGAGGDAQLESLIAAQKEIISATWNVERRSGTGRSADDVRAIAEAQAALKARVEQMSSRPRGRGRAPGPERAAPQRPPQARGSSADPVGAAVEAMTRAVQQLEGGRTRDAIAHEMAALNGLLQAQAEIRRRQVTQQSSSSGSSGSNRAGQDLSALFDKELQRQQRTNYENRSHIEERADRRESQDDALDRIRDLAKRQEALSREQRELAQGGLSAEEVKRRLEKLTREQEELRRQAEELSRQGRQGTAANQMREASRQMREAAGDLRRQDASGAAESGRRAAEQLRRAEQQAQGGSSGAQERARGEMQLEAQQIAQEQRRIASEAERLDKGQGAAAAGARRRLADEKDRLAARVEELQRRADQAARGEKGTAKGAAEAARTLERERVADRMRETAEAMRGGQGGAEAEQQLARTVDKVSEQLGGSSQSADARKLADQLEQTRAIRERLNALEQQIRDAEAKQKGQGRGQGQDQSKNAQELQRLRDEYQRELQRAREALGKLQAAEPRSGTGDTTPEQQEFSRSAPGTEAFKQDRSGWESLRKDVDQALERYEAAVSRRLSGKDAGARLSAGGSERVPDRYRDPVAKYFESLAKVKK